MEPQCWVRDCPETPRYFIQPHPIGIGAFSCYLHLGNWVDNHTTYERPVLVTKATHL